MTRSELPPYTRQEMAEATCNYDMDGHRAATAARELLEAEELNLAEDVARDLKAALVAAVEDWEVARSTWWKMTVANEHARRRADQ